VSWGLVPAWTSGELPPGSTVEAAGASAPGLGADRTVPKHANIEDKGS